MALDSTTEGDFARSFAETTLIHARDRLREQVKNKERFDQLVRFLPGPLFDSVKLGPLAAELGMSAGALAVAKFKLLEDFRRILQELVADTLDVDPSDPGFAAALEVEMGLLYRALTDVPMPVL
jgi:hypothetical protein